MPSVAPSATPGTVLTWYLVNADTNSEHGKICMNQTISLGIVGTKSLSMRVTGPSNVTSILFKWTNGLWVSFGAQFYVEGSFNGDIYPVGYLATVGKKTIKAVMFDLSARIVGKDLITFDIVA
jgi:hypothetical protein